jgi:hypothetical protein
VTDDQKIQTLQLRLEQSEDPDEQRRLRDALAEHQGMSLTGDAHTREGGDKPS